MANQENVRMYIINNKFSNQSITFESEISKEAKNSH